MAAYRCVCNAASLNGLRLLTNNARFLGVGANYSRLSPNNKYAAVCQSQVTRKSSTYNQGDESNHGQTPKWGQSLVAAAGALGLAGLAVYLKSIQNEQHAKGVQAGEPIKTLPTYTLADVAKHNSKEKRIWVTYKNGVYDITDYATSHPGGNKILLAAGSSLEPYWKMYAVHKNAEVFEMLEDLRIGNIYEVPKVPEKDKGDPYANEPLRSPALIPSSPQPFNAEPPLAILVDNFLTPNDLFFVRNHLPVPVVDPKKYRLEVSMEGTRKGISLSLDELKRKFPKKTVASVVQCAGNRRSEMVKIKPVKGLNWGAAALSNAEWSGASLDDVLKKSGIDLDSVNYEHIQFDGMDKDPTGAPYGASIPMELARRLKKDIIIAYEMNGEEIPRDHGYPVRIIIPGIVGARQVKWLNKIIVSNQESSCHWQQKDYKGFHASIDWHNVDFSTVPAIMETPIQSAICEPTTGAVLEEGAEEVTVKGYAWAGGGRGVVRVDLSLDGGKTWHSAEVKPNNQPLYKSYAWTLWEATVPLPKDHKGNVEIICKAVDSSYNVQPDNVDGIWNLRGVLSNAWHRVQVKVPPA